MDDWEDYLFGRAEDKGRNNLSFVMLFLITPLVLLLSLATLDVGLLVMLLSDSAFGAFVLMET